MKKIIVIIIVALSIISCNTSKQSINENTDDNNNSQNIEINNEVNTQARDQELMDMGYDFVAFGNEPFWILKVDFDKSIAEFEQMGNPTIAFKIENNGNNHIEETKFINENTTIDVQAIESVCYDNMSGEGFPFKLSINYKGDDLQGCGKYLGESNSIKSINTDLYGQWILRQINDSIIADNKIVKININSKGSIGGNNSCNSYGGNYKLNANNISFSDLLQTQMFCEGSIEREYMSALNNTRKYKLENKKLSFYDKNDRLLLVFDKKGVE